MGKVVPGKLRWAREYLGFSPEQVAGKLECTVGELAVIEDDTTPVSGERLRQLSRLYRYPVAWFCGETRFEPDEAIVRILEGIRDEGDREAVLDFAEFLSVAGPALKPTRADLAGDDGGPDANA